MSTAFTASEAAADASSDANLCHCLAVSEQSVRDAIAFRGCRSLPAVMKCTGAGQGCTACHQRICGLLSARRQSVPARSL